jgi:hypothetical protein
VQAARSAHEAATTTNTVTPVGAVLVLKLTMQHTATSCCCFWLQIWHRSPPHQGRLCSLPGAWALSIAAGLMKARMHTLDRANLREDPASPPSPYSCPDCARCRRAQALLWHVKWRRQLSWRGNWPLQQTRCGRAACQ